MSERNISSKEEKLYRKVLSVIILVIVFLYCCPQVRDAITETICRIAKYVWGEDKHK